MFVVPELMKKLVDNGWLGAKSGQGFFLKKGKEILEIDPSTFEYVPAKKLQTPSIEMAKQTKGLPNKVKTLVYANDRTGELLWNIFAPTLIYSAEMTGVIADSIVEIDNAMKWGFGWSQGPFEMWDSIGVQKSVEKWRLKAEKCLAS